MVGESEFRKRIQQTFERIERAFEDVDPDVAECEQSLGSLTITLADRARCILSIQPSVRQLWLALAARGTAYHFNLVNLEPASEGGFQWIDDKGKGIELVSFLEKFLIETTGRPVLIGKLN